MRTIVIPSPVVLTAVTNTPTLDFATFMREVVWPNKFWRASSENIVAAATMIARFKDKTSGASVSISDDDWAKLRDVVASVDLASGVAQDGMCMSAAILTAQRTADEVTK